MLWCENCIFMTEPGFEPEPNLLDLNLGSRSRSSRYLNRTLQSKFRFKPEWPEPGPDRTMDSLPTVHLTLYTCFPFSI